MLVALGCPKHYQSQNPFEWMEMISLNGKTNFFEKRVSDYSRAGVNTSAANGAAEVNAKVFSTDEDF